MDANHLVPLPEMDEQLLQQASQLFDLVRSGDTQHLQRLFLMGLVPNLLDAQGNSLLMLAVYHGHSDTAKIILKHGGDPELGNDRGQTPLGAAAFKGDEVCLELLLSHGADLNARPPGGKTALMYAAMFERVKIVQRLLQLGADVKLIDDRGLTAQQLAIAMGAGEAARIIDSHSGHKALRPQRRESGE